MKGLVKRTLTFIFSHMARVGIADANGPGAGSKIILESEDISRDCYLAASYFDGRLVLAYCFSRNSAGEFFLNDSRDDVVRELRIGIGSILAP